MRRTGNILLTGYRHPMYAASLAEFGEPRKLPRSGGWLLERTVPQYPDRDAMGSYPIFAASDWSGLSKDLGEIGPGLVSVALVADPFGEYLPHELSSWFDRVVAFKEHYVVDFSKPLLISKHHRYYSRRAAADVTVDVGPPVDGFAAQWSELYDSLVRRHQLKGIKAFSRASFEVQMKVPGMVVFRAMKNGELLGAHLWYQQQNVVYSHLAASTEQGYEVELLLCNLFGRSRILSVEGAMDRPGRGRRDRRKSRWAKPLQSRLVEQHPACIFLRANSESRTL